MLSHSQRIGHDRQRRIHCAAGGEKTGIDDVKVVDFMRFAIGVERGSFGIMAEANRAVLMRHARKRNALPEKALQRDDVFHSFDLPQHGFEFGLQSFVPFFIVGLIGKHDLAVAIQGYAIVGIGQIFGGEPEIQRVETA